MKNILRSLIVIGLMTVLFPSCSPRSIYTLDHYEYTAPGSTRLGGVTLSYGDKIYVERYKTKGEVYIGDYKKTNVKSYNSSGRIINLNGRPVDGGYFDAFEDLATNDDFKYIEMSPEERHNVEKELGTSRYVAKRWLIILLLGGIGVIAVGLLTMRFMRYRWGIIFLPFWLPVMFMPLWVPAAFWAYLYFNPEQSLWFALDSSWKFGGFIGLIVFVYVAAKLVFSGLKMLFTDWRRPILTIISFLGSLIWAYCLYICVMQLWDQLYFNRNHIEFLVFLLVAFVFGGFRGGASSGGSLTDSFGNTISGNFSGDKFYGNNGRSYTRGFGGSFTRD